MNRCVEWSDCPIVLKKANDQKKTRVYYDFKDFGNGTKRWNRFKVHVTFEDAIAIVGELAKAAGQSHMARREGYASLAPSARSRFPPQKLCQYFPDGIILRWNYSSAIALGPAPLHLDGCLVDPPRAIARPQVWPDPLLQLWRIGLDPAEKGCVVDRDPAVLQHQLKITVADREHQIPAHGPQDHLSRELPAFEVLAL